MSVQPAVVASECCAGRFPQNTLAGFQYCLDTRVDGIEFDVHLSRDGHVVVQHDYLLNRRITRDANGEWLASAGPAVCDLSLAELKRYDVGRYRLPSREAATYPHYRPIDGERIPTLQDFLAAYRDAGSQAVLWIELKTTPFERGISSDPFDLLAAVLRLVRDYDVVQRTVLLAFEWRLLIDALRDSPDIGTDFLTINPEFVQRLYRDKPSIRPEDMHRPLNCADYGNNFARTIQAAGGQWWGPYVADVTAADVALAHDLGVQVNVWGVESDDEAIGQAIALGADALTLSDSTRLQQLLR